MAGAGTRVAQGVGAVAAQVLQDRIHCCCIFVIKAPQLVSQGSKLAGSLLRAANETAPLVIDVSLIGYTKKELKV